MAQYRLFHIRPGGSACKLEEVVAPDDWSAIEMSRRISSEGNAELWCERRLVRSFELGASRDRIQGRN